ncbi:hypothetical protein [Paenibacillus alkalitolerans]|uniref:hypothetical protein n=1 Tax=Paenibacillus alkalitolerans TaxID=2799335 RepID=UPI0018F48D68|nr:hypothetical protein [Paenibacillus alkalitolerans]
MSKMMTGGQYHYDGSEEKRLFAVMNLMAWIALCVGIVMSLWNVGHFSDENLTLMLGIGFMVGSVFIYTIGTAIRLAHNRK